MAKKVVATLKKEGGVKLVKVIKTRKSGSNNSYSFREKLLPKDEVKAFLSED